MSDIVPSVADGSDISDAIRSLIPALFQTFSVILIGYASVKLNVVSTAHKQGLSLFVTRLSLPALLFMGMASLDFSKVDWSFLLAVTIGKTTVFLVAMGVTILLDIGKPRVLGTAGVHAIFVSQSNDFALGLPILLPIFGKTHPDYISYLYLVAPISLVFLNPLGFLCMEANRNPVEPPGEGTEVDDQESLVSELDVSEMSVTMQSVSINESVSLSLRGVRVPRAGFRPDPAQTAEEPLLKRSPKPQGSSGLKKGKKGQRQVAGLDIWKVLYGVLSSPVVFMVPVGLLANLAFDHSIPGLLSGPFVTLGDAFSPLSLFILGMSMADQTESSGEQPTQLGPLVMALALIAGKCLLLPLVIALVLINCNVSTSLVVAGLLYGALPVSPATFFFATEYGLCQAWVGMATVLGTFLFGPLVYFLVQLSFLIMNHYEELQAQVVQSADTMAAIGAIGSLWTVLALCRKSRPVVSEEEYSQHRGIEKLFVLFLGLSWLACCLAQFTCGTPLHPWLLLLRYLAVCLGAIGAPIFTLLVAMLEFCCSLAGPDQVHAHTPLVALSGCLLTLLLSAVPPLLTSSLPAQDSDLMTCWFPYQTPQFYTLGAVNLICLCMVTIIIGALIMDQSRSGRMDGRLSFMWTNLRLSWRPAPPLIPRLALDYIPIPGCREEHISEAMEWPSQPPSRHSSWLSNLSIRNGEGAALGLLEGAKTFRTAKNAATLPPNTASLVSSRWKQRTDIDEQNGMLLLCAYSCMAMLVLLTTSGVALWNRCHWEGMSPQVSFLLLLQSILGFGQGAILFLAYGMHPGLVRPLVSIREWWVEHRQTLFAEELEEQERPQWTDVFGGEVDDCGPRYEKVWHALSQTDGVVNNDFDDVSELSRKFAFNGAGSIIDLEQEGTQEEIQVLVSEQDMTEIE